MIAFESTGVAVGIVGQDAACENEGYHGVAVDYIATKQDIDGFSWAAPAAPVVSATGGRRQVALSFDQERGTQYDIYRDGSEVPFAENIRGNGDDVQVVLSEDADGRAARPRHGVRLPGQGHAPVQRLDRRGRRHVPAASPLSAPAAATTPRSRWSRSPPARREHDVP